VQFVELAAASVLAASVICIPHLVTLYFLRKLKRSPFRRLSGRDIALVAITIGELMIIVPTSTLGFIPSFQVGYFYIGITCAAVASSVVAAYYFKTEKRIRPLVTVSTGRNVFGIFGNGNKEQLDPDQSGNLLQLLRDTAKEPEFIFAVCLLFFYSYLVLIIPVELSYDSANYYLPYAIGLLENGFIPSDPFSSYSTLGGQPALPPGISAIYAYSMTIVPVTDSFKLLPILFTIHLCLATSLLSKEIYPKLRGSWVFIIALISPPLFFFLTTTPYNPDLLFTAFFITSLLYVLKSKTSPNVLWSVLAGASVSGMILTKDAGVLFALPVISLILLGHKKIRKFWVAPFALQLLVPFSFLTNAELSQFYVEHSIAIIVIQVICLGVLLYISRSFRAEYSIKLLPFVSLLIPAAIFLIINATIWGSPIIRTYAGSFTNAGSGIDYPWASSIALRELGANAFPIKPQSIVNLFLSIGYVFFAPILGGIFLILKVAGIWRSLVHKDHLLLPVVLFVLLTVNWVSVYGGIDYTDHSAIRRALDVAATGSIISAIGILTFFSGRRLISRMQFLLLVTVVLAIYLFDYFEYNQNLFSLNSRIIFGEPFAQYSVASVAIFLAMYSLSRLCRGFKHTITPYLFKLAIAGVFILAVSPYFVNTAQVLATNNGSYEEINRQRLSTLSFGPKMLATQDYLINRQVDGRILVYAVDWLSYRTGLDVLELRTIIDLAIMKDYLVGDDAQEVVNNLKAIDVEYIVVPVSGDGGERFKKLYGETKILEVLTEYTVVEARYGNLAIHRLK
jgi:hypothetical protein